jgi:hypothetical protein
MFFQSVFVMLESEHYEAPDSIRNGTYTKIDLTRFSPVPFI